ncbi:7938_t:CDS:2 [Scutellospora calospora]|uniref:7938_t:CDS:1 n=1 Tax=Scutellospora calospora TaxID=85575 RepID=A0ACA9LC73_9GLOM|nr:7938_t:CDS:2 [Scutellospora calospora]
MSIIIGPAIAVTTTFLVLIVVLSSFIGLEKFEVPITANSTLTGYPTWHINVPGLDVNRYNTTLLFSNTICFFASVLGFYWAFYQPQDKRLISHFYKNDTVTTSTPCIHYGGNITAIKYWVWVLRYFMLVIIGCVWLDWPYDALWYQIQALSIEAALVITFYRLYFSTHKNLHEHENLPLNTDNDNPDTPEEPIPQESNSEYPYPLSFFPQPKQLFGLIFASKVHLLGDAIVLIFLNHPNA